MAWANFTHLTEPDTERFTVSGDGKQQPNAENPVDLRILPIETKAGGPDTAASAEVTDFLERERRTVYRRTFNPDLRMKPWLNQAAKKTEGRIDDFIAEVIAQLAPGASEESILEALDVLNEVTRTEQGTAAVQKQVTSATLLRLFAATKGRT
jgi:alkylhydroperoxidase/carboxymuconolactone decarboxylase family protein YurZ